MKIYYLIEVYPKTRVDGEYIFESSPQTLITGVAMDGDKSIEASADGFTFRILNTKRPSSSDYRWSQVGSGNNRLPQVDDMVRIYITATKELLKTSAVSGYSEQVGDFWIADDKNDFLKVDGNISQCTHESTVDGVVVNYQGNSRLSRLLDFTWPAAFNSTAQVEILDGSSQDMTGDNIIQNLLGNVNDDNSNYKITWHADNDSISSDLQTKLNYFKNFRPVIELVEELSSQRINHAFNAYFYLDTNNAFVWKEKGKDTDTLILEEGVDFYKCKVIEKVWEVLNAFVIDCGKDPAGNNIHTLYYDEGSAGEFGLKWGNTIEPNTEIADQLISTQKKLDAWVDNTDKNKQNFPDSGVYPLTLSFPDRGEGGNPSTSDNLIVLNDTEWVEAIRNEAKWQGVDYAKKTLDFLGQIRPKVDIEMVGANWELGAGRTGIGGVGGEHSLNSLNLPIKQSDMVTIKIKSKGAGSDWEAGKKLRCVQMNHEINNKGWTVSFRFEIDIDDAVDYIPYGGG